MEFIVPTPASLEDRRRLVISQLRLVAAGQDGVISEVDLAVALGNQTLMVSPDVPDREDAQMLRTLVLGQLNAQQ